MKIVDYSVHEFIKALDSASPAPGGGSASAVASAMGMGLTRMIGHLTVPKKKFKALNESVQDTFIETHEEIKTYEQRMIELIDEDTQAFNEIMKAFKMPKETEDDKKKRKKAIQEATLKATLAPLEMARISYKVLKKIDVILEHGNQHAISDVGVGALLLYSGLEGAVLNVKINLSGLKDQNQASEIKEEVEAMLKDSMKLKTAVLKKVHQALE